MHFDAFPTFLLSTLLLLFLALQAFSVESTTCPSPPTILDASAFSRLHFDYLIVGGGVAGLTVAARLSENPNIVVGVLEAGIFHQGDPLIDIPEKTGRATGNANYDWNYFTAPEPALGGRSIATPRGKMLGGSSGLNLMAWTRPSIQELDALENFSPNSGWNWAGLLPYFKKSETVLANQINPFPGIPSNARILPSPSFSGNAGPVQASLNVIYSDVIPQYVETLNSLGIQTNPQPHNGTSTGVGNTLLSIDRSIGTRSYAASAYYCSSSSRANLHVLYNAQVTKVTFQPRAYNFMPLTANGVQFVVGSQNFTAKAGKEVILSAGTVQSPQLLELSGIGNPTILKKAGISPLVDLPGVGENLQEHVFSLVQFLLQPGHHTFDELRNNATFAAEQAALYAASGTGLLAASDSTITYMPLTDFVKEPQLSSLLASFDAVASQPGLSALQRKQYNIQRAWLTQSAVPQAEIIVLSKGLIAPSANQSYISVLGGVQHPMSRGSIHINSSNPLAPPVIIGNYLSNDFDVNVVLETIKFIGNLVNVPSMGSFVQSMNFPASVANDTDTINWIKATLSTGSHILGTAAMAPYKLGGVVSCKLKVYNTTNFRVVDVSIIPMQTATHPQAFVYAIGEKAADMILKDYYCEE